MNGDNTLYHQYRDIIDWNLKGDLDGMIFAYDCRMQLL